MTNKEIKVECYSGYKYPEKPEVAIIDGKRLKIDRILERWREPGKEFFKIQTEDNKEHLIFYFEVEDKWME